MDAAEWDSRYAGRELVWGREPNRWVVEACAELPPGRALDVACGEGRNAIWLAALGWQVTGVDFSAVALARAGQFAGRSALAGSASWECVDVLEYRPPPLAFDLVVIAYLQLPAEQRRTVVRAAAGGVAEGGTLLVVGHDAANLKGGVGGPQDPRVLYAAKDLVEDLRDLPGLRVVRAEAVRRPVEVEGVTREAVDALLRVCREAG